MKNIILVDYDCKEIWKDKESIKDIISENCEEVVFLEDLKDYSLEEFKNSRIQKCFLLTKFKNGAMRYHDDLVLKNPYFKCWFVVALDCHSDYFKSQFVSQVDSLFYAKNLMYHIIFDDKRLIETIKECKRELDSKKKFFIVSKNKKIINRCENIMTKYLSQNDWDIITYDDILSDTYNIAEKILVVGETSEDFVINPPVYNKRRVKLWLNIPIGQPFDITMKSISEIQVKMNECGWNIADYSHCTYYSNEIYEEFLSKIRNNEMTYLSLKDNDDFVIWDKYLLPISNSEYTIQNIESFLNDYCCFDKIAQ
ncbi:MAG: hypothetical protein NC213_04350 [Acetobacter sp.]|nr:hypothetical protein [Bacteroides sp.]MCM1340955.1 hypothetical protein [Acetobacter sp.]MCM1432489.1 hypothetical protein [Clostridiales bacterium]